MSNPNFSLFNVTLPVGAITAFAGEVNSIKDSPLSSNPIESYGWMICDGSTLQASKYPELYTALRGLYGKKKSGSEILFNLPDFRGQFLRGISSDADDASLEGRVSSPGGTVKSVGSTQGDALQTHEHHYTEPTSPFAPGKTGTGAARISNKAKTGEPIKTPKKSDIKMSDYETRPVNTFVYYLIKYTYQLPIANQVPNLF